MAGDDDAGGEVGENRDAGRDERDGGVGILPSEKSPNMASFWPPPGVAHNQEATVPGARNVKIARPAPRG
jgi:hypothetical protein